mmetsp:Transcript_4744/g.9774  ORF Transcript_4744/g.9774 Transcript_4744/m.9774 type:complete len:230 (-) Transcript_4744:196-885(-)
MSLSRRVRSSLSWKLLLRLWLDACRPSFESSLSSSPSSEEEESGSLSEALLLYFVFSFRPSSPSGFFGGSFNATIVFFFELLIPKSLPLFLLSFFLLLLMSLLLLFVASVLTSLASPETAFWEAGRRSRKMDLGVAVVGIAGASSVPSDDSHITEYSLVASVFDALMKPLLLLLVPPVPVPGDGSVAGDLLPSPLLPLRRGTSTLIMATFFALSTLFVGHSNDGWLDAG